MDHFLWWSAPRTRARTQAPLPLRAGSVLFLPRAPPSRLAPPTILLAPPSSRGRRKPSRSARRLTAPARRLDASRSRKWEVSARVCVAAAAGTRAR